MTRKKSSPERTIYREYQLALKALKERVRQIRKKGGYVPDIDIAQYSLQYINKSDISESLISEIKSQYRKDIYRGYVTDPETGEFLPKAEYDKLQKRRAWEKEAWDNFERKQKQQHLAKQERKYKRSKKKINQAVEKAIEESINYPDYSQMILNRISSQISKFPSAQGHDTLIEFLHRMQNKFGKYRTAIMFEAAASEGLEIDWPMMYHGNYQVFLSQLINYLPDADTSDRESLHDILEELEEWESEE